MKRLLLVVLLLLPLQVLLGQDFAANMNGTKLKTKHPVNKETTAREYKWEFYSPDLDSYTKPTTSVADGSRFDTSLSPLVDMFNKNYTDQEPIAPGNPATRIVIRKPAIYNAVRKINKYYSKQVARGEMNSAKAQKGFERVLTIAIAALSERSQSFEDALQQNRKNPESLIAQFNRVKLKDM